MKIENRNKIITAILFSLMGYTMIMSSWISDDFLISLVQIVNLHNGEGLTFNLGERVQAFTHPVWFFLISLITYISGEYFFSTLVFSFILSMAAVSILFYVGFKKGSIAVAGISLLMLMFSKAFIDYTSSGLENPLSYFLFGVLIYLLVLEEKLKTETKLMYIYLTMAALFLNRMDYAIILAPIALILFYQYRLKNIKPVMVASAIVLAWFLFSLFYFGHIFPNTYYAKMEAGYPIEEISTRGFAYIVVQWHEDPVTLILMGIGIYLGLKQDKVIKAISIGVILYFLYTLKIGGDFMQGRFYSIPVYISIFLAMLYLTKIKWDKKKRTILGIGIAVVLGLSFYKGAPIMSSTDYKNLSFYGHAGIADERGYYYEDFGLLSPKRKWPEIKKEKEVFPKNIDLLCGGMGSLSLSNRADTIYIDTCALTSPFLSQLPAYSDEYWRIGHQKRKIPEGYIDVLRGKEKKLKDPRTEALRKDVEIISRGEIFDKERLGAILRLNTFNYNIDTEKYKNGNIKISYFDDLLKMNNKIDVSELEEHLTKKEELFLKLNEIEKKRCKIEKGQVKIELPVPERPISIDMEIETKGDFILIGLYSKKKLKNMIKVEKKYMKKIKPDTYALDFNLFLTKEGERAWDLWKVSIDEVGIFVKGKEKSFKLNRLKFKSREVASEQE